MFSFQYGIEIMEQMGLKVDKIHAGLANMFQSSIFRETLAGVGGATIELYNTDGSAGAANLEVITPDHQEEYRAAYERWKSYIKL